MDIIITPDQEKTIQTFLAQLATALSSNEPVTIITQAVSPSPTPSATASKTPTRTPAATHSPTPTPSKTRTPAVSASNTPSNTRPVSPTPSNTPSKSSAVQPTPTPSATGGVQPTIETTFDNAYDSSFQLSQSTANRTFTLIPKPPKAINILNPSYVDANHNTKVFRMVDRNTDSTPGGNDHNRHEYSKRVPFNCDNTRYMLQDGNGAWTLYDATTLTKLPRGTSGGAMPGFGGDCEPFWHPTDPHKIWHTDRNGGLKWYEYNTEADTTTTLFDLTNKFPAGMTNVGRTWFKGEGRPSNDGRYWALFCEDVNFNFKGVAMYDRQIDQIIGWYISSVEPDHSMTSPLGNYFILGGSSGAIAFPKNYQGSNINDGIKLTFAQVEHGDVGLDASGKEVYVQVDYAGGSPTEGHIRVADVATGNAFQIEIADVYPASGEATGLHVSGIISEKRPGWFIVSFESCYSNYGSTRPAPTVRYMYDRVCALEIKPNGRMLHISEHFSSGGSYFNEPQASSNRDGTRIVFASAFNGRAGADSSNSESYMVALPSWAIR